jgi:hypothetical protein
MLATDLPNLFLGSQIELNFVNSYLSAGAGGILAR